MAILRWAFPVALLALAAAARAELVNENLLVELPPGYKIDFQQRKNNMLMTEMVPQGQSVNDWTEMVTVQIFFGHKATPDQLKTNIAQGWLAACRGGSYQQLSAAPQNGYETLVWRLSCPFNPSTRRPEMTWFKAVKGNDSLYVVQKAFKFVPSDEQVATWMRFFDTVKVCDSRLPDRRCPQTKK